MKVSKDIKDSKFNIKILGISLHEILWYFILFSIVGLILETVYCYQTTGVLESRKGLIYGPFCPIYGVGAVCLIVLLNKYKDNPIKLFLYGILLGSILEYFLSFALEAIYGTRFWEYSYLRFNLNGRISLVYSLFWGILAIFLIRWLKPLVDKIIDKLTNRLTLTVEIVVVSFLVFDLFATIYSISIYKTKAIDKYYNLPPKPYGKIETFIKNKIFPDSYMQRSFPNLRFIDSNGNEVYIRDIL